MTESELVERLGYWQQRLRLQDWHITVEIKRARDMELEGKAGTVEMVLVQRRAWVTLCDPLDIRPEAHEENDPEGALVHELLHLYTEPLELPEDGPKSVAEEQMLNAISRALVTLERARQPIVRSPDNGLSG